MMAIIGDTSRVQLNAFVLDKANIVSKLASPSYQSELTRPMREEVCIY